MADDNLGVAAHRQFAAHIGTLSTSRGAKTKMLWDALARLPDGFRLAGLERACPNVTPR